MKRHAPLMSLFAASAARNFPLLLVGTSLLACGATDSPVANSQTHWMQACVEDSQCGTLQCECGVCTAPCDDDGACGGGERVCAKTSLFDACESSGEARVCVEQCAGDNCDTAAECIGDACLPTAGAGAGAGAVFACPESVVSDDITVTSFDITGDVLTLDVAHGGGCERHDYSLCFGPGFDESSPVQTGLRLIHDAHGDTCEAWLQTQLTFGLEPLAAYYREAYRTDGGVISTNYGQYTFGELSCRDREVAAGAAVSEAWYSTDLACETDDDCTYFYGDTTCLARCGTLASAAGVDALADAIDEIEQEFCLGFEESCGPVLAPPCEGPGTLVCRDKLCAAE